mmetsp:Transcript_6714/g.11995  ORF Transcript_6714/g.11995 Transcript_6714/m.11995 type:complete len:522 (-) Transcript_6714:3373-4938(-)
MMEESFVKENKRANEELMSEVASGFYTADDASVSVIAPPSSGVLSNGSTNGSGNSKADVKRSVLGERIKVHTRKRAGKEFELLHRIQLFHAHEGSIWSMKFSRDGKLLATGGKDGIVAIWLVTLTATVSQSSQSIRNSSVGQLPGGKAARVLMEEEIEHMQEEEMELRKGRARSKRAAAAKLRKKQNSDVEPPLIQFLMEKPYRRYRAHRADVLELSWSKNNFLLSASMDRTIRLWHPSKSECLQKFSHPDFVSAVSFHPHDENVFVSGSVDGMVRLWSIPTKNVISSARTGDIITSCSIKRDGLSIIVGTFHGHCLIYNLFDRKVGEWKLRLISKLDVRVKSSLKKSNIRVLGIDFLPVNDDWVFLSTSDSLIRMYRMDSIEPVAEYRGHQSLSSRLRASLSPNGRYLLCASENSSNVSLWTLGPSSHHGRTHSKSNSEHSEYERGENIDSVELVSGFMKSTQNFTAFRGSNGESGLLDLSCALFAPHVQQDPDKSFTSDAQGLFILCANHRGEVTILKT